MARCEEEEEEEEEEVFLYSLWVKYQQEELALLGYGSLPVAWWLEEEEEKDRWDQRKPESSPQVSVQHPEEENVMSISRGAALASRVVQMDPDIFRPSLEHLDQWEQAVI
ncbi:unnamed protein product [Arctogadus glacialis]